MTLTELEDEANVYCRLMCELSAAIDRQWENVSDRGQPDKGPPALAVPDLTGWHAHSDEQRDFIRRAEQDTHLGRFVYLRGRRTLGDIAPGDISRTTPTEAAEAVRLGWAEYVAEPVVRPAVEQVQRALRIRRAGRCNT